MSVGGFFQEYQWPILFYSALILLIVLFRRKIQWQAFGIGLYKTKVGLRLMDSWGRKYRGLVQLLGYIGLGVGFVGMVAIVLLLLNGFWDMIMDPSAPPVVSPVVPGFRIPGFDLKVPLVTGWLALFVVIVIHEFAHGVVSRAHNVKVKSSGLLIFGPIAGAFVEPDEQKLKQQPEPVQYSLFAAGPFSNVLAAIAFGLVFVFALSPLLFAVSSPDGVQITSVVPDYGAANASLRPETVVTAVNGVPVTDAQEFSAALNEVRPGDTVTLETDRGTVEILTSTHPTDAASEKGYLGINLETHLGPKSPDLRVIHEIVAWIHSLFNWIVILSLGIGLANLLPLGPFDGGRMLQLAARQVTGNEQRGDWWWKRVSFLTLFLLLVLLLFPFVRTIF